MRPPIIEFYKDAGTIGKEVYHKINTRFAKIIEEIEKLNIDTALFAFPKEFPEDIKKKMKLLYKSETASYDYPIYVYDNKFIIVNIPIGAPLAIGLMEELGFLGINNFFACGSAGLINPEIDSTNFLLVNRAIRDEGSSYKYEKPAVYTYTDKVLTEKLADYLSSNNINFLPVTTWTTDAFFRETPNCIKKRLKQGAVCVEMECASWCAVARYRGYRFAQLLYTGDVTKQGKWGGFRDKTERYKSKYQILDLMINFVVDFIKNKE